MNKNNTTLFIILLLLCSSNFCFSQNEKLNWYFGQYAGISFPSLTGQPVALLNGAMFASEGAAVTSDDKGNLLFYTNGLTIWNKNHKEMPNGTKLNGHFSSSQAAVIVPNPANKNLYYVFTVTAFEQDKLENYGLQYSTVDLSKDGWNGDVIEKNHFLFGETAERITGTGHANGRDFWVVVHELGTNCFLSYLVTEKGVDTVPVRTCIGAPYPSYALTVVGYMKISQDGKKLASVNNHSLIGFDAFDFDNATGKLSNPLSINVSQENSQFYGLEFSPDSRKLYLSDPSIGKLFRYDISKWDIDSIRSSEQLISDDRALPLYGLQLAPNGKIYCSTPQSYALSVINQPNDDTYQYEQRTLSLKGRISQSGLPNFISGTITPANIPLEVSIQAPKFVCEGDSLKLSVLSNSNLSYASVEWIGPDNFSSQSFNPIRKKIQANQAGYYSVKVIKDGKTVESKVLIEIIEKPIVEGNEVNFPNIAINATKKDSLYIKNTGSSPVEITAKMFKTPSDFHIISPMSFPVTVPQNDSVKIVVEFAPKLLIYYKDSITITATNPCFASKVSYSFKGKGVEPPIIIDSVSPGDTVLCVFSMIDTIAQIDDKKFRMPIYVHHTQKIGSVMLRNLRISITLDGDVFLPHYASGMDIEKREWNDNELTVTLLADSITVSPVKTEIGSLIGTVLLSSKPSSAFRFGDISSSPGSNAILVDTTNGSITTNLLTDICGKELRAVSYYNPLKFSINPNPVIDEMTMNYYLPFDAQLTASLYNSVGEKVAVLIDSPYKSGEYSCSIPLTDMNVGSGTYFLKINAGVLTTVKQVVIKR